MRAHYLQHVPFEGLGSIEPWLVEAGYEVSATRFFDRVDLPAPAQPDLLIVMGGPMGVYDEDAFPWLAEEKRFIRASIESGKAVLGVCLGAQLIASALGASVYPNHVKEIGWFPVESVESTDVAAFRFPQSIEAFHWHGDTFDLPADATHLARSAACENQAFQVGRRVIGLQFHLETTPESLRQLASNCRDELRPSRYVQSEADILAAGPDRFRTINRLMAGVLDYLMRDGG